MKCSICGCENEENVTVCVQCGSQLAGSAAEVFCTLCGKQLRPTAKFCVYCGEKLAAQPPLAEVILEDAPLIEIEETDAALAEPQPEVEAPAIPAPEPQPPLTVVLEEEAFVIPRPACPLPVRRSLVKMIFLGILTAMLYPLVILSRIAEEINIVASRHDGRRTMQLLWVPVLSSLTLGVYLFVWYHALCSRIGDELHRRGIGYRFGAASFWLWNILWGVAGSLVTAVAVVVLLQLRILELPVICMIALAAAIVSAIGPFVFVHKLMRATNLMNADYNENG